MKKPLTTKEFITKSLEIHQGTYDYSKVIYVRSKLKVNIICRIHGEFYQMPNSHLKGRGCPFCNKERLKHNPSNKKLSLTSFINKSRSIHGDKYIYDKVIYTRYHTKIVIICPKHGDFKQTPANHLHGFGCKKCAVDDSVIRNTYTNDEFINKCKKVHKDLYEYSNTEYNGIYKHIHIICKKHGDFIQKAHDHLSGCGCPTCNKSKGELYIENWLKQHNIVYTPNYKFKDCVDKRKLPFDFYIHSLNLCIEFDGQQHFIPCGYGGSGTEAFQRTIKHDKIKNLYCLNNKIKLIRISYKEIKNIDKILSAIFSSSFSYTPQNLSSFLPI